MKRLGQRDFSAQETMHHLLSLKLVSSSFNVISISLNGSRKITKTGSLVITGDFNFHVDDTTDTTAANFLSLLESFDLKQHVPSCTHRAGHTLDLVITRDAECILNAISVDDSSEISDHYTVCADLHFVEPNWERKRICGRKLKAISLEHFRQDVVMSPLLSESSNDLLTLLQLYNSELSSVLDKHAPLKSRMVTIRPAAPWFSEEIKLERRVPSPIGKEMV